MSPDQPSREQIEARITALLLGELPAAEADLLRWTIEHDAELKKLHDQLKLTIGFVREAIKNPSSAPVERETPLKLPQDRRRELLAHFKTARPQKSFWLKHIEIPSARTLAIAAVIIVVICGLAAISIPNFVKGRATSQSSSIINNLRQIDAAKQEWALEKKMPANAVPTASDLSPYMQTMRSVAGESYVLGKVSEPTVAEIHGKQLTAEPANSSFAVTDQASRSRYLEDVKPQEPTVAPQLPPIALPNTELSREESEQNTSTSVFSQNVVGYVNEPVANAGTVSFGSSSQSAQPEPNSGPTTAPIVEASSPLPGSAAPLPVETETASTAETVPPPPVSLAPPPSEEQVVPMAAGDSDLMRTGARRQGSALKGLPETKDEKMAVNGNNFSGGGGFAGVGGTKLDTGVVQNNPNVGLTLSWGNDQAKFRSEEQTNLLVNRDTTGITSDSLESSTFKFGLQNSEAENVTNTIAMGDTVNQPALIQREEQNSDTIRGTPAGGTYMLKSVGTLPQVEVPYDRNGYPESVPAAPALPQQQSQQPYNSQAEARSYDQLKRRLDDKMVLHELLAAKIESDKADLTIPQSSIVTISEPAQPAQSQNFWQRLTGEVESETRIKIEPDTLSDVPTMGGGPVASYAPYDPYFMQTEVKSIQSDAVLGKVVDALKLDQAWSKEDGGEKISRKDAIAMLKSRLDLEVDKNTKQIEIGAKSDKPDEAANIANAVVEAYTQYRLEMHSQAMQGGINVLTQKYDDEDKEIGQIQAELQRLKPSVSATQANKVVPPAQQPASHKQTDAPLAVPQASVPIPQPEILTSDNAFSTFSLNVSDVSFKLASASLGNGQMPSPASIRSEEFINAFDYHDPEPLQGQPLAFAFERATDPFAQEHDLLRFSIKAAALGRQEGRALNLVLLLDTSGSMERADRVAIIREALRVLSAQLQPQDTVSVVTFARTARLWADGVPGNQAGATLDKVGSITPDGGTNLEEAMRLAYETALRHFIANGINRVVLLTDGAANLGNIDPQALTHQVEAERRQGIALDCFGIGWEDYNDDLLEQLSSNGDGRYAFINSPDEASTEFAAKLAGALQVAAEDVKVQVEFNQDRVTAWRQIGYAKHQLTKEQFRDNSVAAGAIASREAGNALYVIKTIADGEGPIATVRVRYRVPGTQDNLERSWLVDYTGAAPTLAQSSPAMRLAATAAEFSEWLSDSPFAQDVTLDDLLNYISGVPQFYGSDERPKQLEWAIRQAKSVSGK